MKPPAPAATLTVLVVDDNRDAVLLLDRVLKKWGYGVHVAHDGVAAVALAQQHGPDVVLLDIGLPGMNGYQVAQALRAATPPFTGVLVALTGYGKDEDRLRTQEEGFAHHLLKPVDLATLRALLESLARPSA
jgi:CheY-like chemotaxis protein